MVARREFRGSLTQDGSPLNVDERRRYLICAAVGSRLVGRPAVDGGGGQNGPLAPQVPSFLRPNYCVTCLNFVYYVERCYSALIVMLLTATARAPAAAD